MVPILLLCCIVVTLLGLNYSNSVNNFIFSNVINSYDPLKVKTLLPFKKDSINNNDWEDSRGMFPILAYNMPDKTNDLTASLKILEKGGINIVINSNLAWIDDVRKVKNAFKKLENSDLMWMVQIVNDCEDDFIYQNSNDDTNKNIKKYLREFNDDFVYGWYLWDEPGKNRKACSPLNLIPNDDYVDINTMSKQIQYDSMFNKKLNYVNLFPTYWEGTPTSKDYENYIDAFINSQEYKPRVLCFDHYPFQKTEFGDFRRDYYLNLEIVRKKSLEYNIPFWMLIFSSEHDKYEKPAFEEISFQVYSALAYGAKGIGYYLYSKGWEQFGYKSWILEDYVDNLNVADSLHGKLFVPVQKLNENIQSLGKILANLKSVEVIHTSDYPNKQKEITQSLFRSNQDNSPIKQITNNYDSNIDPKLLIGVFEEMNNTSSDGKYLMIVNKDVKGNANFTLALTRVYDIYKINKESGEKEFKILDNKIELNVKPGVGELLFIE